MMKVRAAFLMPVVALFYLVGATLFAGGSHACSETTECTVREGVYRVAQPPGRAAGAKIGAIFFFHGFTGSSSETATNSELAAVARKLGIALVATEGIGGRWSLPGVGETQRDEIGYVERVVEDAVRRFDLDPERLMASGFSLGGSMVWYLACRVPERFAAFAPVAGAFWEPIPESCAGPRPKMMHFHGLSDATVPIAGRLVRSGSRQADVFKSLAHIAPACNISRASNLKADVLTCSVAADCPNQAHLEVCLHPGGHDLNADWVELAWRDLMQRGAPDGAGAHVSVKP